MVKFKVELWNTPIHQLTKNIQFIITLCSKVKYTFCLSYIYIYTEGTTWSWSYAIYGSWIYNYLCNQWLSPLKFWFWIPLMARCTWYSIMWQVSGFLWVLPISSSNKTEILVKSGVKHHNSNWKYIQNHDPTEDIINIWLGVEILLEMIS